MTNNFVVPPSLETEARNYYKFKSPADSANIIWQCFAEPVLQRFGAISNDDTTFGREGLPRAPDESQLRSDPRHSVSDCRVQLDDHSHSESAFGSNFLIAYSYFPLSLLPNLAGHGCRAEEQEYCEPSFMSWYICSLCSFPNSLIYGQA